MTTSAELKRVYASAPSDRRYIETLDLYHPRFPRRFFIVNDVQAWQFLLESGGGLVPFVPVPFHVQMPTVDGKGQQDMQVQIDNIGREAMDAIEAASADPTINITTTLRIYLDVAGTAPQTDPPITLALQSVTVDAGAIVGTATRADVLNRPFPTELYRVDLFPGLNR
jgi:Domain of unknown function (DUF1833)